MGRSESKASERRMNGGMLGATQICVDLEVRPWLYRPQERFWVASGIFIIHKKLAQVAG